MAAIPVTIRPWSVRVGETTSGFGAGLLELVRGKATVAWWDDRDALNLSADDRVVRLSSATPSASSYLEITNGSGTAYLGVDQGSGGNIFAGTAPHATAFGTATAHPVHIATSGKVRVTIDADGVVWVGTRDLLAELDAANARITVLEARLAEREGAE